MKQITVFLEGESLTLMQLVEGSKPQIIYEDPTVLPTPYFQILFTYNPLKPLPPLLALFVALFL